MGGHCFTFKGVTEKETGETVDFARQNLWHKNKLDDVNV